MVLEEVDEGVDHGLCLELHGFVLGEVGLIELVLYGALPCFEFGFVLLHLFLVVLGLGVGGAQGLSGGLFRTYEVGLEIFLDGVPRGQSVFDFTFYGFVGGYIDGVAVVVEDAHELVAAGDVEPRTALFALVEDII